MVDKVEATKNLKKLEDDHYHLAHLNHLNSTQEFKNHCAKRMRDIQEQQKNIKHVLKRD